MNFGLNSANRVFISLCTRTGQYLFQNSAVLFILNVFKRAAQRSRSKAKIKIPIADVTACNPRSFNGAGTVTL